MPLDTSTLLSLLLLELLSLMVMLPLLMGAAVSRAARFAQGYIALQCVGWMALWLRQASGAPVSDGLGGFVAMLSLSASLSALWLALRDWLGRRPGRWAMTGAPLVLASASVLDGSGADHFAIAWSGLGLALQMLALALACSWPREAEHKGIEIRHGTPIEHKDRAWRTLLGLGFGAMAAIVLVRAGLHFLGREEGWQALLTQAIILGTHVMLLVSVLAILVAWRGETELHLQRQAHTDALTGLFNRRYLEEALVLEFGRASRTADGVGVIVGDLDHFKRLNDTHGHDGGDAALRAVAQVLVASVRKGDIACRHGGEEFVLVLPGATLDQTRERADELRRTLAQLEVPFHGKMISPITMSIGVAVYPRHGSSPEAVLRQADKAMYQAKQNGRNRIVVAGTFGGAASQGVSDQGTADQGTTDQASSDQGVAG